MPVSVFATGFSVGLSLILAIGAQNAFVLRQGLRNEHVLAVVLACALSDAILIAVGVTSFAEVARLLPSVELWMRFAGAAFLIVYGARSFLSAFRSTGALAAADAPAQSRSAALATALALTWLNPHVYLDTVVLVGTLSTQFPGNEALFGAGAVTASFVFFFSLGFGARRLRPLFARPSAWRVLEAVIGATMWIIAAGLLLGP